MVGCCIDRQTVIIEQVFPVNGEIVLAMVFVVHKVNRVIAN